MSRPVIDFPDSLQRVLNCDWDIDWRGQSAGTGNDGQSQIVYNRFPRWYGSPTLSLPPALVNAWRALRAQARGRAAVYRLTLKDLDGLPPYPVGLPFSTEELFSTDQGFRFSPWVTCSDGAAAGVSEIVIEENDFPIVVGQFASHADWPFVVTWKRSEGAGWRIGVEMPLRRAIPAGARIDLRAQGLFLATDDTMGNPSYGLIKVATPQLSFVEWLNRP
ncbi:hypothetical protein [Pseudooceanicola algae]|uniref:Uncharacterized protein n=1 Tax=Pseudooceanicola algae TaxID=1537215 RepID=A0A418SDC6_9RHOB|nr:hypothetical protein [Pseudooceanicola algae]QPM89386.1 hypothetical protein PSAL_006020 [Pseudooceanicola algae]